MRQLELDGVALSYEEAGEGESPVLLVHGWCCDHTYFARQFEHFVKKGCRVVAVDLREHGGSDKPHQPYTMQVFADDLARMCELAQARKAGGGRAQHGGHSRFRPRGRVSKPYLRRRHARCGRRPAVRRPRGHPKLPRMTAQPRLPGFALRVRG
jgi:Alpha/beta hydrolase family